MKKSALKTSVAHRAAPLSSARRKVSAERARVRVRHLVIPGHETKAADAVAGERLSDFLTREGWSRPEKVGNRIRWMWTIPTICLVNGEPLLQRQWKRRRINATDEIAFVSRPHGGRGKAIAGIAAAIALAVLAPWAGGAIATGLGLSTAVGYGIAAGIAVGGSLLINALFKPKAAAQAEQSQSQVDQLYTVQAQGNTAKPLQPIPVQYGRLKIIPDYVFLPYSEFEGNDQYLHILLSRGMGKYSVEEVLNDDTPIWDSVSGALLPDVEVWHYNPNETITAFPVNITTSVEVTGQELPHDTWIGGFIANAAGTQANFLAVDLVFPQGIYEIDNSDGSIKKARIEVVGEYRPVDNDGNPTGAYTTLFQIDEERKSRQPVRMTQKVAVAPGRYQVQVRRTHSDDSKKIRTVAWVGLRAFLINGVSSFPCSTTAIRIRASAFTQESARRLGVIQTRVLPVWDSGTEQWQETATRNPWWAFYDMATESTYAYGPRRPLSTVDFQTIVTRANAAESAGITFDHQFTSQVPVPEAFDTALKVDRSRHRWSGDRLSAIRDEYSALPRMLLTDREIIRDSVEIKYEMLPADSADSAVVEYLDETIWRPAEVQYPPNSESFTSTKQARFRIDGIVDRGRAYDMAAFLYKQHVYRRISINLQTEHDGKLLGYGDAIAVQTELPDRWGQATSVKHRQGNTLIAARELDWTVDGDATQFYARIRTKTGRQFGPIKCSTSGGNDRIVLDNTDLAAVQSQQGMTLAEALSRADGCDEPTVVIGVGTRTARNCLVVGGNPSRDRVSLRLVVNDSRIYDAPTGMPELPEDSPLKNPLRPVIEELFADFQQGNLEPMVRATWRPARGAIYYQAQVSYDEGVSWVPVYEGTESGFTAVVEYSDLRLRVRGVSVRGPGIFASVDLTAPDITAAPGTITLESMIAGLRYEVQNKIAQIQAELKTVEDFTATLIAEQDAANAEDRQQVTTQIIRERGLSRAEWRKDIDVAVGPGSAIAQTVEEVNAAVGEINAQTQVRFLAAVAPTGAIGMWELKTLAENAYAGLKVVAFDDGMGGAFGHVRIQADRFYIEGTGANPTIIFIVDTVSGKVYINGDIIAPGSITAAHINAGVFNAINANISNQLNAYQLNATQINAVIANITNLTAQNINSFYAMYNNIAYNAVAFSHTDNRELKASIDAGSVYSVGAYRVLKSFAAPANAIKIDCIARLTGSVGGFAQAGVEIFAVFELLRNGALIHSVVFSDGGRGIPNPSINSATMRVVFANPGDIITMQARADLHGHFDGVYSGTASAAWAVQGDPGALTCLATVPNGIN